MPLQRRDHLILKHVARFGIATQAGLRRLFFSDLTPKAVERVTTRLIRINLLR